LDNRRYWRFFYLTAMLTGYRFVHGPVAVWSCTSCHEAGKKGRKLATMKPDERICSGCHEYNWMNKKFIHDPTAAGGCTTCHNTHATDIPLMLKSDYNSMYQFCQACHKM